MPTLESDRPLLREPVPALSKDTPLCIVFNAASGSGDKQKAAADIKAVLREADRQYEFFHVDRSDHIVDSAKQAVEHAQKFRGAVVVAGGDGTINVVAALTLPTRRPFGILPQGTFNYTCRAHGIPLDTIEATRSLLSAHIKPVQVGLIGDRVFLVNASLGLYPQLLEDREAFKRQYGRKRLVAILSGLRTLLHYRDEFDLELEHDGRSERFRTPTLFVGNNALQLDQVGLPEADAVQQRKLAAVLVKPVSRLAMVGLAFRGAIGRLHAADNVHDFAFSSLHVRRTNHRNNRPLKIATDGELCWMKPPLQFRVDPRSLMLMVSANANARH